MNELMIVLKGMLVGVANIIPGVSGGTLALMLGIYKRIIDALRSLNMEMIRKLLPVLFLRRGSWPVFWEYVKSSDLLFLGWLGGGAMLAIILSSRVMTVLLERYHAASYAFFFGLVLCSIYLPWRYLSRRSWREGVSLLLAAALTVGLSMSVPDAVQIEKAERKQEIRQARAELQQENGGASVRLAEHPDLSRLGMIFMAAVLAISAMVLPGISGSFVLLLLGVYFDILTAINQRDLLIIGVFALGALSGLLVFSRVMGLLLNRFFNITMAFMTGLMAGSLYVLWPFKRVVNVGEQTLYLSNVWRGASIAEEAGALVAWSVGCLIVIGFTLLGRGRQREGDGLLF